MNGKKKTNRQIFAEDRLDFAAAMARGMDELMTKDGRRSVSATDRTRKPDWCDEHASPGKNKKRNGHMTKSLEEMREWLNKKIERDTEWMRFIEGLNADGESFSPGYIETKQGVERMQAILAALAKRADGPSVEERNRMLEFYRCLKFDAKGAAYSDEEQKMDSEIEALILGNPAPGKGEAAEEKRKE